MKMYLDFESRSAFTYDEIRRIVKMLSAADKPDSLRHFLVNLVEVEVSDHED